MNSETFLQKKEKKKWKEKYSNSKNFVSQILSQISSSKLHKNLQHFIFSIPFFLSCLLCIKLFFKNFIVCVIPVSKLESCGTYCLNLLFELTVWTYRLILHTKAPLKHYPVKY